MRDLVRGLGAAVLILLLGTVKTVSAGSISGFYDYVYTVGGDTVDPTCSSGVRDHFTSTSGSNTIGAATHTDPVSFSICYGVVGALAGGQFTITDGAADIATGQFSGTYTGLSAGNGAIFDGAFEFTSLSGYYASVTDAGGKFEVITGDVNKMDTRPGDYLTGTFEFDSTPEPVTAALAGSGLLLLILSRKGPGRRG
jgi:hypothetical protein